jgi:hypothetical protein
MIQREEGCEADTFGEGTIRGLMGRALFDRAAQQYAPRCGDERLLTAMIRAGSNSRTTGAEYFG